MFTGKIKERAEFLVAVSYYAVLAALIYVTYRLINILLPFVIGFVLAALLQPLKRWMQKKLKINKKALSIALTALIYLGAGAVLFILIIQLVYMLRDVLSAFPDYYKNSIVPMLSGTGNVVEGWLTSMFPSWQESFSSIQNRLVDGTQSIASNVTQAGISLLSRLWNGLPGFLIGLLFTILLSFPIGTHYDSVIEFLLFQVPDKLSVILSGIRSVIKDTLLKYIKAQLMLMVIVFAGSVIGLLIIRSQNAFGMAVIIAFFDLLPVFGPGTVMIPWAVIELLQGNIRFAIGLAVVYTIITIGRNIIAPRVVGSQLGMHPIISLLSIYIGYRLLGFFGMIAFPIIVQILLAMHEKGSIRLFREKQQ